MLSAYQLHILGVDSCVVQWDLENGVRIEANTTRVTRCERSSELHPPTLTAESAAPMGSAECE